jgi:hypothetical protein
VGVLASEVGSKSTLCLSEHSVDLSAYGGSRYRGLEELQTISLGLTKAECFKESRVDLPPFIAMINGLMRQRGLWLEEKNDMRDVTMDFCHRSLVKN